MSIARDPRALLLEQVTPVLARFLERSDASQGDFAKVEDADREMLVRTLLERIAAKLPLSDHTKLEVPTSNALNVPAACRMPPISAPPNVWTPARPVTCPSPAWTSSWMASSFRAM